jgi:plasmid stabilization system protein ParE
MPQIVKTQNYVDDVNYYILLEDVSNNRPMIIRILRKIEKILDSLEINPRQYQLHPGGTRSFNIEGRYTVVYEFDYTDKKSVSRVDDPD